MHRYEGVMCADAVNSSVTLTLKHSEHGYDATLAITEGGKDATYEVLTCISSTTPLYVFLHSIITSCNTVAYIAAVKLERHCQYVN